MSPHPALKASNAAVLTGAGIGGIGYSVAHLLLTRYQLRVLLVDISAPALFAAQKALIAAGAKEEDILTRVVDVSNAAEVFELADYAFETFGKVDFLLLNAGVQVPTKDFVEGGDLENWTKTLGVNLFGVLHGTQVSGGGAGRGRC